MKAPDELERANKRAKKMQSHAPRAISARYDPGTGRVVLNLSSRLIVSFAPADAEGLESATPAQLRKIEISPSGFGLHFPAIDADLYIPALLEGFLGSKSWMAARLGQAGGQSTSRAKKAASRANGQLGGRPRKTARRQVRSPQDQPHSSR
ncbi:MAG: DUF2442 domain-containing protein [Acidobacteriota bacterium]|nr:DUF2442 domain-containing protein [Acidobacteriota bacterium]